MELDRLVSYCYYAGTVFMRTPYSSGSRWIQEAAGPL